MSPHRSLSSEQYFMRQALHQARRAWGRTSPNPMVGAVLTVDEKIVGRGCHWTVGEDHAEIAAIKNAGGKVRNADLYVTLEPCSTFGRTPPCTEAIIQSDIRRVIVGCEDPNPDHCGRGLEMLQKAGIEVETGIEAEACRRLNEAFFCWIKKKRPFTILKMAMTLDGKIATAEGVSKWITGSESRKEVQKWRRWSDAVMIGGETARRDKPRLNVREPADWQPQPLPIIWSPRQKNATEFLLKNHFWRAPEIITPDSPSEWRKTMREFAEKQITALLVEGGGELAASCLQAGVVDKVLFFIAPKILGGRKGRPVVGGVDPENLSDAWNLENIAVKRFRNDILISGYVKDVYRTD